MENPSQYVDKNLEGGGVAGQRLVVNEFIILEAARTMAVFAFGCSLSCALAGFRAGPTSRDGKSSATP